MYQEDAEALDHRQRLVAEEDDRRKGTYTPRPGRDEFPWDPFFVSSTTDEFGQQRWFVEDSHGDWISDAYDTRDLAEAELASLGR